MAFYYLCVNFVGGTENGAAYFLGKFGMKIVSSNIRTADYDGSIRVLTLTFINRPMWVYKYLNVPPNIWVEFVRSESKGQYFSQIIREKYNYTRTMGNL